MSSDPTLAEVKRMLAEMLRNSNPKPRVNKQEKLAQLADRIYAGLIKACAKHGFDTIIIQRVLDAFRIEGLIQNWAIMPEKETSSGKVYEIHIQFNFNPSYDKLFLHEADFTQDDL